MRANGRYYADVREYPVDVIEAVFGEKITGQHVPLRPKWEKFATDDQTVAIQLYAELIRQLEDANTSKVKNRGEVRRHVTVRSFTEDYLAWRDYKKRDAKQTQWMRAVALYRAGEFFGDKALWEIKPRDVEAWSKKLRTNAGPTSGKKVREYDEALKPQSVLNHLHALSALFKRASQAGVFGDVLEYNPVRVADKPAREVRDDDTARWLEVHEAALLLEAARLVRYKSRGAWAVNDMIYPIVATMLLTGGRAKEVLGLLVDDVDLENGKVHFRPNLFRDKLKTETSKRTVPLWPQLRDILTPYLEERKRVVGETNPALLFPSTNREGHEAMVTDIRKALANITKAAGLDSDLVHPHACRHTYCSARLQTLDGGRPIAPNTVSKELGHRGRAMVDRVYGHCGDVRHRSEFVEYRVEHFLRLPGYTQRLEELRRKAGFGQNLVQISEAVVRTDLAEAA